MNKLNIKEANEHLKQLHRKVFELENQVHMHTLHTQELERTNAELRQRLKEAEQKRERELAAKAAENEEIRKKLSECESRVDVLLQAAEERDKLVMALERKARLFYEVVEHRAALNRIVEVLDDLHKQKEVPASTTAVLDKDSRTVAASNGTSHTTSDVDSPDAV